MTIKKLHLIILVISLAAACAPLPRPGRPGTPTDSREPPVTSPSTEGTPARTASDAIVTEGIEAFNQGLYDRSSDLFQEAASIDPSNGVAYYYLALTKIKTGEYGEAAGLVDKAEHLLPKDDPEWTAKIEELKQELR